MKTIKIIFVPVFMSFALMGCTIADPMPLPTEQGLAGTYLAISNWDGYRLDLFSDGRADLAVTYVVEKGTVHRYATEQWELNRYLFSAEFLPVDTKDQPLYMRANASGSLFEASISTSSTPGSGSSYPSFIRESRAQDLIKLLTNEQ